MGNERITETLSKYGKIHDIRNEKWSTEYAFPIYSGIRAIKTEVKTPVPSRVYIAGYKAFITYDGQQQCCYYCNETTHIRLNCPARQGRMTNSESAAPRTFSEVISQNLTHDPRGKDEVYGNERHQAKGEDESMNVSEIYSSQEGMEEVYENRLGEQEKADSRSSTAVTTEETHQVAGTMVRARTQPSKTFFENTHPQRNELTVLKLEEEQRVIVKSRATGQAETSWGRR
jgi:hypothetical protein